MTTQPGILAGIAAIAAPALAMEPSAITLNTYLRDRVDSLAMVDLVVAAEDAFGVRIPDEDAERFETVGDVVSFISGASRSGDGAASLNHDGQRQPPTRPFGPPSPPRGGR